MRSSSGGRGKFAGLRGIFWVVSSIGLIEWSAAFRVWEWKEYRDIARVKKVIERVAMDV